MTTDMPLTIAVVTVCLIFGGILKGATGAGAPILAIPALALFFDVRFAIVVMIVPNLLTNFWQGWRFRGHLPAKSFVAPLVIGGVVGVLAGTYLLASLPLSILPLLVAFSVLGYVTLRLMRPDWVLSMATAKSLSLPAGVAAGVLQGASGLSAPVSITFLNAMRLPRPVFVATISVFFAVFSVFQLGALMFSGIAQVNELLISVFALGPIAVAMPLGARVAKSFRPEVFDRVILGLLTLIALRLIFDFAM